MFLAKRAACGFATLCFDVRYRGSRVDSGPSRKPCVADDLDDCIDVFCSTRSRGSRSWQSYCTPAFQECVEFKHLFVQRSQNGIQLFPFDVSGRSGNDVSGDAAKDVGLVGGQFRRQFRYKIARDGGKGVSVVKAERREAVALQADFERLSQGKFLGLIFLPEGFSRLMSVGSGFVQRVLLLAKAAIDFSDICQSNGASQGLTRRDIRSRLLQ